MDINPYSALSSLGTTNNGRKAVADNFDTFLQLLVTQLRNQDPTDPLDTNQFTQQLVQYSEVEQTVKANENLEKLTLLAAANAVNGAVGYIGQTVSYNGEAAQLQEGKASWGYTAKGDASDATFTVIDSTGNEVYSEKRSIKEGIGTFAWDGRKSDGLAAAEGSYKLRVSAKNAQGGTVNVTSVVSGTVDGVDMTNSEPYLVVHGQKVKIADVVAVNRPVSNSAQE